MKCTRCRNEADPAFKLCSNCRTKKVVDKTIERNKWRKFLDSYLKSHPCPCGIDDPDVLVFSDPSVIRKIIASAYPNDNNYKLLFEELKKHNVQCCNCYAKSKRNRGSY